MIGNAISVRPQLVIGLGTGRCGTDSLARFLNFQEGAGVSHERFRYKLAWCKAEKRIDEFLQWVRLQTDQRLVGDVASAYLPYVEYILAAYPKVKFICLQRERTATIESFMKKNSATNHWMDHDGNQWQVNKWDACFPKYSAASKAEAIGLYWDEYYKWAAKLQANHPTVFRIFSTASLNQPEGQQALLAFVGIPREQMRLVSVPHYNRSMWPSGRWGNRPSAEPVVSVLMMVHKSCPVSEESIATMLNQSFTAFEFFIIDDGACATTSQLLATYAALDQRIILLQQAKQEELPTVYNRVLALVRGRYLAIAAPNAPSQPERLQQQVAYLDQHDDCGILLTCLAYGTPQRLGARDPALPTTLAYGRPLLLSGLLYATIMVRRNLLLPLGDDGLDQPALLIYALAAKLRPATHLANLPEPLVSLIGRNDKREVEQHAAPVLLRAAYQLMVGEQPPLAEMVALQRGVLADERLEKGAQVWQAMGRLRRLHCAYLHNTRLDARGKRQLAEEVAGYFACLSLRHLRLAPLAVLYASGHWLLLKRQLPTMTMWKWAARKLC